MIFQPVQRINPRRDLAVGFECGCLVTFLGSTELRSSRMECCDVHKLRDATSDRDRIYNAARSRKRVAMMIGGL